MECRVQMIAWHSRTNGQPWKKRVNAILHREIRSSDCTNVRHILPHIFCNQFYFLHSPMLVIPIPTNCSFRVHHFPSSTFFPINFRIHFHLPYCIVRIISKFRIGSLVGSTSNSSMTTEVTFLFESADSAFTAFMIFPWSETREKREREKWENEKLFDQIKNECFFKYSISSENNWIVREFLFVNLLGCYLSSDDDWITPTTLSFSGCEIVTHRVVSPVLFYLINGNVDSCKRTPVIILSHVDSWWMRSTEFRRTVRIWNLHSALWTKLAAIVRRHSSGEAKDAGTQTPIQIISLNIHNVIENTTTSKSSNEEWNTLQKRGKMSTTNQTQLILFIQTKMHAKRNTFCDHFFPPHKECLSAERERKKPTHELSWICHRMNWHCTVSNGLRFYAILKLCLKLMVHVISSFGARCVRGIAYGFWFIFFSTDDT